MEQDGTTVYRYVILGMVCTDKPIDWPNESVVLSTFKSAELTTLLNNMDKKQPPCKMGDANSALLNLIKLEPYELE